jgi:hypothetical protein
MTPLVFVAVTVTLPVDASVLMLLRLIFVGSDDLRSVATKLAKSTPSVAEAPLVSSVKVTLPPIASGVVSGSLSSATEKTASRPSEVYAGPTSLITATSSSSGKTLVQQV